MIPTIQDVPGWTLRKFTAPDVLGKISTARLFEFLTPWRDYLSSRGRVLTDPGTSEVDYGGLARVLMSPDAMTPADMVDALYYVCEVSDLDNIEGLYTKATAMGLPVERDPQATALDYVIDVWTIDPELIRQYHAEAFAQTQQSFDYYAGQNRVPKKFPILTESIRAAIEAALDGWFEEHSRGRGCRLVIIRQPGRVWIVIRHGSRMRREASHKDDGGAGTAFYRPQLHDVLIYDESTDEIGVHCETKRGGQFCRQVLGQHLFNDPDYFQPEQRYSLLPLIEIGAAAMACDDIAGLEHVTLVETRIDWGGRYKEVEIRRASDLFAATEQRGRERVANREPAMAAFKVKFSDSSRERRVVIRMPASARYERNEDSDIFEYWLRARGFLLNRQDDQDDDSSADSEIL